MKTLHIDYEDKDYAELSNLKGDLTWVKFIQAMTEAYKEVNKTED